MKRFFLLVVVFTFICCWSGMAAAGSKPPAKLCLDMNPSLNSYMVIMTKSFGSVTMSDGATGLYSVAGVVFATPNIPQWTAPVTGTGYMYKGLNAEWFHFSVQSYSNTPYGTDPIMIEVYWNVVTKTGMLDYYLPRTDFHVTENPVEVDCKTIALPPLQ